MRWRFKHIPKKLAIDLLVISLGLAVSVILNTYPSKPPNMTFAPEPPTRPNQSFTPDNASLPKQSKAYLISKIQTKLPVVFLTMDDGIYKDMRATEFIKSRQWPVTLFLIDKETRDNYGYFKQLVANGADVQNHTITHSYLNDLTYAQQKNEICGASDKVKEIYGKRPTLLRPPGGYYDQNTLLSSYKCGIKAVVMWSAKIDDGTVQFQKNNRLVPGDIVLMHFRPKIMEDLSAFETEINKRGLHVARLEDWIRINQ